VRRVVVTGMGVVSAVGTGCEPFWRAVCEEASIGSVAGIRSESMIPLDVKPSRTMGRIARLAVLAARLALEDGRIEPARLNGEDLGVFLGTNLDDINFVGLSQAFRAAGVEPATGKPDLARFVQAALGILHPFDYLKALSNMPAAHVAINCRARGMNCSYVSPGISGAEAIGEGYLAVRDGRVERALAGGADSWRTPFGVWRRGILGGASSLPCSPSGVHPTALGLGEGAAMLLLEPLETARLRNARVYGEVGGCATALDADAFPNPSHGTGLVRCMRRALARAGVSAGEVDYVGAPGAGSIAGDRIEAQALQEIFGPEALPPLRAMKAMTGYLGAASGAVEAAVTLLVIDRQRIPLLPKAGKQDPGRERRGTDSTAPSARIRVALNVASHPMGLSAALVFKAVSGRARNRDATP